MAILYTALALFSQDSKFPTDMQPNPNLYFCKENNRPAKFDYKLNNIFRLHSLPVSW